MHELSIVMNILETVEDSAIEHKATGVSVIELEIGLLSGIEFDALEFAFEHAPKSKILQNVKFLINKIQPSARCAECQHEFETNEFAAHCPKCNSFRTEIIKGDELRIASYRME